MSSEMNFDASIILPFVMLTLSIALLVVAWVRWFRYVGRLQNALPADMRSMNHYLSGYKSKTIMQAEETDPLLAKHMRAARRLSAFGACAFLVSLFFLIESLLSATL